MEGSQHTILPNILHQIGNTPLVQINKVHKSLGLQCQICKFCCISSIPGLYTTTTFYRAITCDA